jgi:hypothetical protein
VQKVAGQYIVKKITEGFTAPPAQPDEPAAEPVQTSPKPANVAETQQITDENGQLVGTAVRLPEVVVYVVRQSHLAPQQELARALAEPEGRLLIQSEDGRITGLVYVPDPTRAPARAEATRADDV